MPFAADGTWRPEDDNVAAAVAGVVNAGGPLMKQAAGMGIATANKRGLANSSMAVGASQNAVLAAATPIGTQQAAQTHAKNLQALSDADQYKYGTDLQQMTDTAAKERLGMQIGSDKDLQTGALASNEKIVGMNITSNEKLSANQISASLTELQTKIASDEKLAANGDVAAMARLQASLASQKDLQAMQDATQMGVANLSANTSLQTAQMAQTGETSRLGMQIGATQQQQVSQIAAELQLQREKIAADATLSAADRAQQLAVIDKQIAGQSTLQTQQDTASLQRQREQIAANASLSEADRAQQLAVLDKQIAGQSSLQTQQDTAAMARQNSSQVSQASLQSQADLAALQRQREDISSRTDIAAADRQAQMAQLDKQIVSQQAIVDKQQAGAMDQQKLQSATQLNLGQMESDTSKSNAALSASTSATSAYMQSMSAMMANENIPADVRNSFAASMQKATEGSIGIVEQITGTDLAWGANTLVPAGAPPGSTSGTSVATGGTGIDPSKQYISSDGTINIPQQNGFVLQVLPDGSQQAYDPSTKKTTQQLGPGGTPIAAAPSAGAQDTANPNRQTISSDGTINVAQADGTVMRLLPDGSQQAFDPATGQTIQMPGSWKTAA